jgi:translation initiation factor IF-1
VFGAHAGACAIGADSDVTSRKRGIVFTGNVIEALPNDLFRVRLDGGQELTAHLTGRTRMSIVRILPGDRVRVEVSELDLTRGRIIDRLRTAP